MAQLQPPINGVILPAISIALGTRPATLTLTLTPNPEGEASGFSLTLTLRLITLGTLSA